MEDIFRYSYLFVGYGGLSNWLIVWKRKWQGLRIYSEKNNLEIRFFNLIFKQKMDLSQSPLSKLSHRKLHPKVSMPADFFWTNVESMELCKRNVRTSALDYFFLIHRNVFLFLESFTKFPWIHRYLSIRVYFTVYFYFSTFSKCLRKPTFYLYYYRLLWYRRFIDALKHLYPSLWHVYFWQYIQY